MNLKKIIFESLSNIFDINKLLLYQILNVNEKNDLC